jgi:Domain of unknown function (DUF3850)
VTEHELKSWPMFFEPVLRREKTFEIRFNDRGYKVGDTLLLREWDPNTKKYSGREVRRRVLYVTEYMQTPGWVTMSIEPWWEKP